MRADGARLLLLLCWAVTAVSGCPVQLTTLCGCSTWLSGLQLNCTFANFSDVTAALRDLRSPVYQLIVSNSAVPLLGFGDLQGLSVRQLHFIGNNMTQVGDDAFKDQAESLEALVINDNGLTQIPKLDYLPRLHRVDLVNNQLSDVPERVFAGNPRLQQLRLKGNQICSLTTNALNETKASIELLDLSNNCLHLVPAANIRGAARLTFVDLSGNQIDDVPNLQFMNLPELKEVRLNDNQIVGVKPMAFINVPNLAFLHLRNNRIPLLEPRRWEGFKQLEFLDLGGNAIKRIPSASFQAIPLLEQVILDRNEIEAVETMAFTGCPRLRAIGLPNNRLRSLFRNAFDSLPAMQQLDLENNTLEAVGPGQFAGMQQLQHLNLRGNRISVIEPRTFETLPELTTLDLGQNALTKIGKETFTGLKKLFWLDLCCNGLQSLEEGTFKDKVANMLLNGNALVCDEKLDWFVSYLVNNNVRTFLPNQGEVTCAAPEDHKGMRLKDLMIDKANRTFFSKLNELMPGTGGSSQMPLGNLIPSLNSIPGLPGGGIPGLSGRIPGLDTMSRLFPDLNRIPGLNALTSPDVLVPSDRGADLLPALSDLTTPLSRLASGGRPAAEDINQMVGSIPRLVQQLPGGAPDLSKIPPEVIRHVMSGGQIPGVSRDALDAMVRRYLRQMASAAEAANSGHATTTSLPPLTALPSDLVERVLKGTPLPGLTPAQTAAIRDYYTAIATTAATASGGGAGAASLAGAAIPTSELLRLMSSGEFSLDVLPPELLQKIASGQPITLAMIPQQIVEKVMKTQPELAARLAANLGNAGKPPSIDDLSAGGESATVVQRGPGYDLNAVSSDVVDPAKKDKGDNKVTLYTGIGLAVVGAVTLATVAYLCYRRRTNAADEVDRTSFLGAGGSASPKSLDSVVVPRSGGSGNNNLPAPSPMTPADYRIYAAVGPSRAAASFYDA